VIERIAGHRVKVIDNALAIARYTQSVLDAEALIRPVRSEYPTYGKLEIWCSGDSCTFSKVFTKLFGYPVFAQQIQPEREPSGSIF
jgi:glutamate racemase